MLNCQIRFQCRQEDEIFECQRNEVMEDIINRYKNKLKSSIDKLCFLYDGKQINPDLNLSQIDGENKEILILVNPQKSTENENTIKKSNNIIKCFQCNNPAILEFSNDYKITLFDGEHRKKKINLQDFNSVNKSKSY